MSVNLFYRIGLAEATLRPFYVWGLTRPELPLFGDHTTRRPQGGGGEGRHGFNTAQLLWRELMADQAHIIEDLITTAEVTGGQGNGTLWLTLPRTDASASGMAWIDISGIAIMPQWEAVEGSHGLVYANVVLRLTDCTVENEPSTVL